MKKFIRIMGLALVLTLLCTSIAFAAPRKLADIEGLPELPDVDLLIRTGGEKRLSNFLLWQTAYAEFIFSDTLWPDYSVEEFKKDVLEFESRNRRFGGIENKKGSMSEAAK